MKHAVINLLLLALLCGCTNSGELHRSLEDAERMMSEQPDAAKRLLESVDRRELRTRRARARFALLYSQALDKNYIDVDCDTLAHVATDFYLRRGTPNERALACYYRGRVYENANEVDSAIIFYTQAEENIAKTGDYYMSGLIANALGKMYDAQSFNDLAIEKYLNSAKFFSLVGHRKNVLRNYLAAIGLFLVEHDFERLEHYLDLSEPLALELQDYSKLWYLARSRAHMVINRDSDYQTALSILHHPLEECGGTSMPGSYYPLLANIYLHLGQLDSACLYAKNYLEHIVLKNTRHEMEADYLLSEIYAAKGSYKLAYAYGAEALFISDSLYLAEKDIALPELEKKYRSKQLELENDYLHNVGVYQRYISLFVILSLSLIAAWLIYWWQQKIRRHRQEIGEYRDLFTRMKSELQSQQALFRAAKFSGLDEARINRRIEFLRQLLEITSTFTHDKEKFHAKIKELLTKHGTKGENEIFLIFQDLVEMRCPGIIDYIKTSYPDLSNQELTLYCMICLGISNSAICFVLETQPKTYYNYRNILRSKLHLTNSNLHLADHFQQLCAEFRRNVQ